MNRLQYLLNKLAEEAAEVGQIALKTSQFGMDECLANQPYDNRARIHQELDDLMAIVELLNNEFNFEYVGNIARRKVKKDKVEHYYQYSVQLGLVT